LGKKAFNKLFLEAVDDALSSLGDSAKQSIYFHLESKFKIPRNEIPYRFQDFAAGLEKIFGVGARFLEILIMKKLYEKTGKPIEWNESKEFVFVEYLAVAKQSYIQNSGA
jgi:hypothetical protein